MKRAIFLSACVIFSCVQARAETTGMDAFKYYLGTWKCSAGIIGKPPAATTVVGALRSGVLDQFVSIPRQKAMKQAYGLVIATTYDPKSRRYFETNADNQGYWEVSVAQSWTGNTETWTDVATSDGKLGHATSVRTSENNYVFTSYERLTSTTPDFRATCTRST